MTYTYKCKQCQHTEDKQHGMNEQPTYMCCKQPMVKLLTIPLGIHGANTGTRKGT